MGYWENTTYVQHGSALEVAKALTSLLGKEQMEPIEVPPRSVKRGVREPMQYDDALHNDLWGIAVFPGAPSWTVLKTAPLELLAERRVGADRMRLAELCAGLSASAIQVNVYDGTGIVLVEVSREGEALLSGFGEPSDDLAWHSEQLDPGALEPQFRIHPLGELVSGSPRAEEVAAGLSGRLGGENASSCDNLVSVDTLILREPLAARGGRALYFRWSGASRVRSVPGRPGSTG